MSERFEELRRLAEIADPSPWVRCGVRYKFGGEDCFAVGPDGNPIAFFPIGRTDAEHTLALRSAEFAARARKDVPDLLSALVAATARAEAAEAEAKRLREWLSSAKGYMLNAKIDLETGTKKKTTIDTLTGGLRLIDAALAKGGDHG